MCILIVGFLPSVGAGGEGVGLEGLWGKGFGVRGGQLMNYGVGIPLFILSLILVRYITIAGTWRLAKVLRDIS